MGSPSSTTAAAGTRAATVCESHILSCRLIASIVYRNVVKYFIIDAQLIVGATLRASCGMEVEVPAINLAIIRPDESKARFHVNNLPSASP